MNWYSSVWKYRCPRCRETGLFIEPIDLSDPLKMKKGCEKCGQTFMPEPGFYWGAMYVSYAICSLVMLPLGLISVFVFEITMMQMLFVICLIGAITFFPVMRLSRSLWIHTTVKYRPPSK